jgi:hypothetical protein
MKNKISCLHFLSNIRLLIFSKFRTTTVLYSRRDVGFLGDVFPESSEWENIDVNVITNLRIGDNKEEEEVLTLRRLGASFNI